MIRAFGFLLLLTVVVVIAVWLADRPGDVRFVWLGYEIETSVGVLAIAAGLFAVLVAAIYRLWLGIRGGPSAWRRIRESNKRRRGHDALVRGMSAVAAGNVAQARKEARKARRLLDDSPLALLVSAQAAQLAGDSRRAQANYDEMVSIPETAFLGLSGLLNEATRVGDDAAALDAARRAHKEQPRSEWIIRALFDLETRAGNWRRALDVLRDAGRRNVYAGPDFNRRRAIVHLAQSMESSGEPALRAAQKAYDTDNAFPPAALRLAELLIAAGRPRPAARVLERLWSIFPLAPGADLYGQTVRGDEPLECLKAIERLAKHKPEHIESHIAVARAALEAGLWGKARRHLSQAESIGPTASVFRLLAALEEAEHGDLGKARYWLDQAAEARPDPGWVCDQCGSVAVDWSVFCGHCSAFDSLRWRSPAGTRPLAVPHLTPAARLEHKSPVAPPPAEKTA